LFLTPPAAAVAAFSGELQVVFYDGNGHHERLEGRERWTVVLGWLSAVDVLL